MKIRVKSEDGAELSTIYRQLKLPAADGKQRLTDVATAESLLRIVQSIPSPKAEPIKLWLAKVGYERMQEMADPALSLDRALYYASSKRRRVVPITAQAIRQMLASGKLPPPLEAAQAAKRCKACSLQERCQPQATHAGLIAARVALFDPDA